MVKQAGEALFRRARTVSGGIALTLATVGLVEVVNAYCFAIPRPTSVYLIAVAAAALVGGLRSGLISALIVIAFSAYVDHVPRGNLFDFPLELAERLGLFTMAAPMLAVLVGLLRRRNDDLVRDQLRGIHTNDIARVELDREHRIAITLQNALQTPIHAQDFPGLGIGYCYEAAWAEAEIGGDFFDVLSLDSNTVAVVVGDISGKGLGPAAKTAEIKYTLRAFLHGASGPDNSGWAGVAGETLSRVNNYLLRNERSGEQPQSIGPLFPVPTFVCLVLAIIRTDTGETDVAVAAMEPPIIVRRDNFDKLGPSTDIVEPGGLPLGVVRNAEYQSTTLRLALGDTLALATDGVTESRRPGTRDMFGFDGLQLAVERALAMPYATTESLTAAAERVVGAAKRFGGIGKLKDDACVLLVQLTTTSA